MKELNIAPVGKTDKEYNDQESIIDSWFQKYGVLEKAGIEFQPSKTSIDVLIGGTFVGDFDAKSLTYSVAELSAKIDTLADDFFGGGNCE